MTNVVRYELFFSCKYCFRVLAKLRPIYSENGNSSEKNVSETVGRKFGWIPSALAALPESYSHPC
jgi:hypothetical protein